MAQHFEDTAGQLLTELVQVVGKQRTTSLRGAVAEPGGVVTDNLRCSIQPRSTLDSKTTFGRLPEMSHLMYCRAEDSGGTLLDIHQGDEIEETGGRRRKFRVLSEPQVFPDFVNGGLHHLEIEMSEKVYG
jgi:hypothetical protein